MPAPVTLTAREQQLFPEVALFLDSLHAQAVTNLQHTGGFLQTCFSLSEPESLHLLAYWQQQQDNKTKLTQLIQGDLAE